METIETVQGLLGDHSRPQLMRRRLPNGLCVHQLLHHSGGDLVELVANLTETGPSCRSLLRIHCPASEHALLDDLARGDLVMEERHSGIGINSARRRGPPDPIQLLPLTDRTVHTLIRTQLCRCDLVAHEQAMDGELDQGVECAD